MAVKTDGSLYSTGINSSGQLGLGDTVKRNEFTLIGSMGSGDYSGRPMFGGGSQHSHAIHLGKLQSTGYNSFGQLADGTFNDKTSFADIMQSTPDRGTDTWEYVVLGKYHTMAIRQV